jgi:hypothetical protein
VSVCAIIVDVFTAVSLPKPNYNPVRPLTTSNPLLLNTAKITRPANKASGLLAIRTQLSAGKYGRF